MASAFEALFIRRLREQLAEEIARHGANLLKGNVRNFDDYKNLTGKLHGLHIAVEHIDRIEKELTSPDDPKERTA